MRSPRHALATKDAYIDDLKHENNDLKHGANSVERMEETLHNAQYALDKSTGDRLKLENEFKIQVDNDAIIVNRCKNEGIDLKHSLADRNEEIARLRSTLSNLKYTVDLKRGDFNHLQDEFKINKEDNDHLKGIASNLDRDIKVEIDVNNNLKSDLRAAEDAIRKNSDDHAIHVNRIKDLEAQNAASRAHQNDLNRDIDNTEHKIRDVTAQINVLEGQRRGLQIDLDHLNATIADLKAKLDAETALTDKITADLGREIARGKDLQAAHAKLTATIADRRAELDALKREFADLNEKIKAVTASNADMEYQLNELKRHIEVLTKQNADLNIELEQILDRDRKVREELDRRQALADKQRVKDEEMKKSLSSLALTKTRSPTRP